jgi:hypothetical protein
MKMKRILIVVVIVLVGIAGLSCQYLLAAAEDVRTPRIGSRIPACLQDTIRGTSGAS